MKTLKFMKYQCFAIVFFALCFILLFVGTAKAVGLCENGLQSALSITASSEEETSGVSIDKASNNFGKVIIGKLSVPQTFIITNESGTDYVVGTIGLTETDASQFVIPNDGCSGRTLLQSESCAFDVVFSPTLGGSMVANLEIPFNDSSVSTINVQLSGIGAFCVETAEELHDALIKAQNNGKDDILQVVKGTYTGSFIYVAPATDSLVMEGGYAEGCTSRVIEPSETILDGDSAGVPLIFSCNNPKGIVVDGFTIQKGISEPEFKKGGGLVALSNGGKLTLANNIITGNTAVRDGGGAYIEGFNTVVFDDNAINKNKADRGGGMFFRVDSVDLANNIISENTAEKYGGGIFFSGGRISFTYNIIDKNTANSDGGGVHSAGEEIIFTNNTIDSNTASNGAGGVYVRSDAASFINNTITKNTASGNGGGIWFKLYVNSDSANVYNNIIWSNSGGQGSDLYIENDGDGDSLPSTVNLFNNDFDQSSSGTYIALSFPIDANNIDDEAPLFVDENSNDYHLQAGSPCIGAGNNNAPKLPLADMDGYPRIMDYIVDIGAYEYPGIVFVPPVPDIKANGLDGSVTISPEDSLTVAISFVPGTYNGEAADWWIIVITPFGPYHYAVDKELWMPGISVASQRLLFGLSSVPILSISGLPTGTYTFIFGVDVVVNGSVDFEHLYYDSVGVNVSE